MLTADAMVGVRHLDELRMLECATTADPNHRGYTYVIGLFDHFEHTGPYGIHQCLVLELMGGNLDVLRRSFRGRKLPVELVKAICRQVLLGLKYLHQTCGIVHAGSFG